MARSHLATADHPSELTSSHGASGKVQGCEREGRVVTTTKTKERREEIETTTTYGDEDNNYPHSLIYNMILPTLTLRKSDAPQKSSPPISFNQMTTSKFHTLKHMGLLSHQATSKWIFFYIHSNHTPIPHSNNQWGIYNGGSSGAS